MCFRPPKPLGKAEQTRTRTVAAGRYLPKDAPITSHQPYLGAIADEPCNCPRVTLDYLTPEEAFTQLIAPAPSCMYRILEYYWD